MYALLIILYVFLVFLDQITKQIMFVLSNGNIGYSIDVIGEFFKLTYIENHGGIFGLFQGNILVFTVVSTILIAYLLYTEWNNFLKTKYINKVAIVFIAAGATGNMLDRYFRGFVIDMIDFRGIWGFIFNVADMWIHIGIYILIYVSIREYFKKK